MTVKLSRTVLVAGGVIVVVSVISAVVLLALVGDSLTAGAKMIIINQLIITIPSMIAGIAALAAKAKVDEVQHDLQNGLIPEKVKETINEMAADPEQGAITINSESHNAAYDRGVERGLSGD